MTRVEAFVNKRSIGIKNLSECCEWIKSIGYDELHIQFPNLGMYLNCDENDEYYTNLHKQWVKYITETISLPVQFDQENSRIIFLKKDFKTFYSAFVAFTIVRLFYEKKAVAIELFKMLKIFPNIDPITALWLSWWYLKQSDTTRGLGGTGILGLPEKVLTLEKFNRYMEQSLAVTVNSMFICYKNFFQNNQKDTKLCDKIMKDLTVIPMSEELLVETLKEYKILENA